MLMVTYMHMLMVTDMYTCDQQVQDVVIELPRKPLTVEVKTETHVCSSHYLRWMLERFKTIWIRSILGDMTCMLLKPKLLY